MGLIDSSCCYWILEWNPLGSGPYQPAGIVHADEFVVKKSSLKRIEKNHPGLLDAMNNYGEIPGHAKGGRVKPLKIPPGSTTYPGHTGRTTVTAGGRDVHRCPAVAPLPQSRHAASSPPADRSTLERWTNSCTPPRPTVVTCSGIS